jgi:phosphatidylserine/phosphatidylglycerophosphate/cardiolipin synthase-like enzyme
MRVKRKRSGITVRAISGTYVVFLGIDASKKARKKLLGFAIRRTDWTEEERYWLRGLKTFKSVEPEQVPGRSYPTYEHPIQSFQWSDYTAKPDHRYSYEVVPMYGAPKMMQEGGSVEVMIETESTDDGKHAVFFNRGVAASQAYARRFDNRKPDKVPDRKAYIWLSRGLEEAMLGFIGRAKNKNWGLRAAVYEFNYQPVLSAFKKAHKAGADVKIIYDSRKDQPKKSTLKAIKQAGLPKKIMIPRRECKSYISHNKFIILLHKGKPQEVWTGSTNFTKGGIFGQSNLGHVVRDKQVAQSYLDYWQMLSEDPKSKKLKESIEDHTPDLQSSPKKKAVATIFSPRKSLYMLNWYGDSLDAAKESAHLTAAFGVNAVLAKVLGKQKAQLRYLLLEKEGDNRKVYAADKDVQVAVGSKLGGDALYGWTEEALTGLNLHVLYFHTKYMLIDPLSSKPLVISGSANFSDASTIRNDENMLVIAGDRRVADIYLGEFMRLHSHYYFRDLIRKQKGEHVDSLRSLYLAEDDSWTRDYFKKGTIKFKKRVLFAQ